MGKLVKYVKGVFKEGKRVRWPKRAEFWGNIAVVLSITVIVALFLAFDDFIASKLLGLLEEAFANWK
ncbi:MAG: preprotein translocase subunit SecE [Bacilli bacterium]|nr:preprotein translocase subunit SecE [Bacilli bacterium]